MNWNLPRGIPVPGSSIIHIRYYAVRHWHQEKKILASVESILQYCLDFLQQNVFILN